MCSSYSEASADLEKSSKVLWVTMSLSASPQLAGQCFPETITNAATLKYVHPRGTN